MTRKTLIIFFALFLTTSLWSQTELKVKELSRDLELTKFAVKENKSFRNAERTAFITEADKLLGSLKNSKEQPDSLYLAVLEQNLEFVKEYAIQENRNENNAFVVKEFTSDLKFKNERLALARENDELIFLSPVKVITRRKGNNGFVEVSGYKVYANPWVMQNNKPALIKFPNSTNPSSEYKIPPGKYFFWVESVVNGKIFPVAIEATIVEFSPEGNSQIIFIDVN